ncbi:MAG: hypothetical protein ACYC33_06870 [Thermoleophilia bacterium]
MSTSRGIKWEDLPKEVWDLPHGKTRSGRRCTAQAKNSGTRCLNLCRTGFPVCSTHGAGTLKRERLGTRQPAGGPKAPGQKLVLKDAIEKYKRSFNADVMARDSAATLAVLLDTFVEQVSDGPEDLSPARIRQLGDLAGDCARVARSLIELKKFEALTMADLAIISREMVRVVVELAERFVGKPDRGEFVRVVETRFLALLGADGPSVLELEAGYGSFDK